MQLTALFERDDAVSPVVGFVLVVGGAVMLGLIVVTFIMGLDDTVSQDGPAVEFSFEYNPDATGQDSFGTNNSTFDGLLLITHEEGAVIEAERLAVVGASSQPVRGEFSEPGTPYAPADTIGSGTQLSVYVRETDQVTVVWRPPDESETVTVGRWNGPDEDST